MQEQSGVLYSFQQRISALSLFILMLSLKLFRCETTKITFQEYTRVMQVRNLRCGVIEEDIKVYLLCSQNCH